MACRSVLFLGHLALGSFASRPHLNSSGTLAVADRGQFVRERSDHGAHDAPDFTMCTKPCMEQIVRRAKARSGSGTPECEGRLTVACTADCNELSVPEFVAEVVNSTASHFKQCGKGMGPTSVVQNAYCFPIAFCKARRSVCCFKCKGERGDSEYTPSAVYPGMQPDAEDRKRAMEYSPCEDCMWEAYHTCNINTTMLHEEAGHVSRGNASIRSSTSIAVGQRNSIYVWSTESSIHPNIIQQGLEREANSRDYAGLCGKAYLENQFPNNLPYARAAGAQYCPDPKRKDDGWVGG